MIYNGYFIVCDPVPVETVLPWGFVVSQKENQEKI